MAEKYLRCSYSKGMFPDESTVKFLTTKGFEWIFSDNANMIRSDEKLGCKEYEGWVKIKLYDQNKDMALIGIRDAGAGTQGKLSIFCVPLEEIVDSIKL